jgi:hypothetical protein
MTPSMLIERAVYLGNFVILFETQEGEMRTIDFKPLLKGNMGAFDSLRNEEVFKKFYLDTGILTWDVDLPKKSDKQINQFDIAPEYIYENSIPVVMDKGEYRINVTQNL